MNENEKSEKPSVRLKDMETCIPNRIFITNGGSDHYKHLQLKKKHYGIGWV